MPVQQELICADEERAGAAGGIEDADFLNLLGCLAFDEFAHSLPDDVIHNVGGCVIDAAGFSDLRF